MKLHLGCGNDIKEGYVNCDRSNLKGVDKVVDLEKPLPFKDNEVEEIITYHTLEHIINFIPLMHEFHRICLNNTKIKIKVPFYSTWGQYNDPTHVRFFSPFTFDYFKYGNYSHELNCTKDMFKVNKCKLNFGIGSSSNLNWLFNPIINLNHKIYCRFFAWILPCAEIEFELEVLK